jgi:hypothetical protein
MTGISQGYEPAQNAAAGDCVIAALYAEFQKQGINVDANENVPELIGLADAAVETLMKVGVVITQDL